MNCVYKPCEFLVRAENVYTIRHVLNRIFNRKSRLNLYICLSSVLHNLTGYIWWRISGNLSSNFVDFAAANLPVCNDHAVDGAYLQQWQLLQHISNPSYT